MFQSVRLLSPVDYGILFGTNIKGRTMRKSLIVVGVCVLLVALVFRGATPTATAVRWEYAQLEQVDAGFRWIDEKQSIDANAAPDAVSNLRILAKKMDPQAPQQELQLQPVLAVYNAVGKVGWEFVREEERRVGVQTTWFRRPR
jgi:hypothetical protein